MSAKRVVREWRGVIAVDQTLRTRDIGRNGDVVEERAESYAAPGQI